MKCQFICDELTPPKQRLRCLRCGFVFHVSDRWNPETLQRECQPNPSQTTSEYLQSGPLPTKGPGHYLTQLLSPISNAAKWLQVKPDCDCQKYAAEMDRMGVEWCEANIETIVGWLREGAAAHSLPFSAMVARWFINRAIRQAKQFAATPPPPTVGDSP